MSGSQNIQCYTILNEHRCPACKCGDENFSTYQQLDSACNKACGGESRLEHCTFPLVDSSCSLTGSSSTTCGSAFNMAIYSVTDLHGDPKSSPAGYVGCYVDAAHNGGGAPLRIKPAGLTVDMCIGGCKELNYTLASMTQGSLCFCSNKWGGGSKQPDNQCTQACAGNSQQICGSANNAVLYDTTIGAAPPVKPAAWKGRSCRDDPFLLVALLTGHPFYRLLGGYSCFVILLHCS